MKNSKSIIWLMMFVFLLTLFTAISTYAYFTAREIFKGSFEIEVESKGVDTFKFVNKENLYLNVSFNNFMMNFGSDVEGTASLGVNLTTTKKEVEYCYKMDIILPEEVVIQYTDENPDLILNIRKKDKDKEEYLIKKMDITEKTGIINIPTKMDGKDYVHKLKVQKNKELTETFYADVIFTYKNVDQTLNDNKSFTAYLDGYIVDCKTGEKLIEV